MAKWISELTSTTEELKTFRQQRMRRIDVAMQEIWMVEQELENRGESFVPYRGYDYPKAKQEWAAQDRPAFKERL